MPIELAIPETSPNSLSEVDRRIDAGILEADLKAALNEAAEHLELPVWSRPANDRAPTELLEYVEFVVTQLLERLKSVSLGPAALSETGQLAVRLQRINADIQLAAVEAQIRVLSTPHRMAELFSTDLPPAELLQRAVAVSCMATGLSRSMVFRVSGGYLHVAGTHFVGHDEWAADCHLSIVDTPADLSPGLLETEMLRRKLPALMTDTLHDPNAFKPIVERIRTPGYVAVPIVVMGEVVATLHLDAYFNERQVDGVDRDVASTFAESLAWALERSIAIDQLRRQRSALRDLVDRVDDGIEIATGAPTLFTHRTGTVPSVGATPDGIELPNRLISSLSRREVEVLQLMTSGATNAEIAQRLVLAEGTVKTHVKRILRKLRASNRGQAAAIYLRYSIARP
ncbi:LuxR C-terminal-related transcriptional regulator [Nocardia sp. NPDC050408]|uniref:LuxR C-terminal-related transcriptional regulator n=1 Tax=Nocardia sp. NPDC050408 TaxID=3364319 RepID=UPI0037B363DC